MGIADDQPHSPSPRAFSDRRNPVRKGSPDEKAIRGIVFPAHASDGPMPGPMISLLPSVLAATAIIRFPISRPNTECIGMDHTDGAAGSAPFDIIRVSVRAEHVILQMNLEARM